MIVDSSALLAVLSREPDSDRFQDAILTASQCRMSVTNILEVRIVAEGGGGAEAGHELNKFLKRAGNCDRRAPRGGAAGLETLQQGQAIRLP